MPGTPSGPVAGQEGGSSGFSTTSPVGVWGDSGSGIGVAASSGASNTSIGLFAIAGGGAGVAGAFTGDVQVGGNLTKNAGSFKIDHPLDPASKYLSHSFVESPDMKNIYDGIAALDANGEATVELPAWFEPLNQDFRYQLTPIGAPGPSLYVAEEITQNRFKIAGGTPGAKVSWQVTGTRHDVYADAHRIQVEEDKPEAERGYYLHPELYNQPPEKSIDWARHPELMQRIKEREETNPSVPYPPLPVSGPSQTTGSLLDSLPNGR